MATWGDISALVEAFQTAEGIVKNDALYRALANRALGKLSTRMGHLTMSWNNDGATGSPTISGRQVTVPVNLIDIVEARWNDIHLDEASSELWLDQYDELWRTSTGTPSVFVRNSLGLKLNREPTGSTSGLLDIEGLGSIPLFGVGTTNPLVYLPEPHHYLLADWMIANLPIEVRDKTAEQIAVMREARAKAEARWEEGWQELVSDMIRRKVAPISGG